MANYMDSIDETGKKHFETPLPEEAVVTVSLRRQVGAIFTVELDGETTDYILSYGDDNFPDGKAVVFKPAQVHQFSE